MKKFVMKSLVIAWLTVAAGAVAFGQSRDPITDGPRTESASQELLREVRLTRQSIEQLRQQLIQLQALAIQIRMQQDTVAALESRIDANRSESLALEEMVGQLRDRAGKLESARATDDEEAARNRAELVDTRKDVERQQQRLDLLRSHETQLTAQLQVERTKLRDLLVRLDTFGAGPGETSSSAPTSTGQIRPPNN